MTEWFMRIPGRDWVVLLRTIEISKAYQTPITIKWRPEGIKYIPEGVVFKKEGYDNWCSSDGSIAVSGIERCLSPRTVDELCKEMSFNSFDHHGDAVPYLLKNVHGNFAIMPSDKWEKINSELRKHRSENLLREYRPFRFYDPVWGETLDMIYAKPHSKMSEYFTNKLKTPMPKEPEYNSEIYGEKEKKEGFKYSIEIQGKKIRVNKDGDIKWSCGEVIKNKEIEELAEFIDRIKEMN